MSNIARSFSVNRETYYFSKDDLGDPIKDGIDIILQGTSSLSACPVDGVFSIRWKKLFNDGSLYLHIFQDALHVIPSCSVLLQRLSSENPWTREEVKDILLELGYTDITER